MNRTLFLLLMFSIVTYCGQSPDDESETPTKTVKEKTTPIKDKPKPLQVVSDPVGNMKPAKNNHQKTKEPTEVEKLADAMEQPFSDPNHPHLNENLIGNCSGRRLDVDFVSRCKVNEGILILGNDTVTEYKIEYFNNCDIPMLFLELCTDFGCRALAEKGDSHLILTGPGDLRVARLGYVSGANKVCSITITSIKH